RHRAEHEDPDANDSSRAAYHGVARIRRAGGLAGGRAGARERALVFWEDGAIRRARSLAPRTTHEDARDPHRDGADRRARLRIERWIAGELQRVERSLVDAGRVLE